MLFYFALLSLSQTTVADFNKFCPRIVKISSDFQQTISFLWQFLSFSTIHKNFFFCILLHLTKTRCIIIFGQKLSIPAIVHPSRISVFLSYWWYYYQLLDEPSLPNLSGRGLKTCQNMPRPPKYKWWCHFAVKPGSNPWIMAVEMNTNDI